MLKQFLITTPFLMLLVTSPQGVSLAAEDNAGEKLASQSCAACHGADGNSVAPTFPNLAGQAAGYIVDQLTRIKSGERAVPAMASFVADLSADDMQNLASFYSAQTARPASIPESDVAAAKRGERLYRGGYGDLGIPACTSCHSPNGYGIPQLFPRVAGQYRAYLIKQLLDYKSGQRQSRDEIMNDIAFLLSEQQIEDVSAYMRALK